MDITITKEKILQAAEENPCASSVLKILFPDVFHCDAHINITTENIGHLVLPRSSGNYHNRGIFLHESYNWQILKDSVGVLVLVPTKK